MQKIELEIVALSHSITQSNSYAVILGEVNGLRRLPIVIGGFEAQAIAVALENMHPSRPLTHDLMNNLEQAGLKIRPFRFEPEGLRSWTARERKNHLDTETP